MHAAKLRCVAKAGRVSPEMLDIAIEMARNEEEASQVRLKAIELVMRIAFPQKSIVQVSPDGEALGTRFLDVVFIHRDAEGQVIDAKPNGHDTFTVSFDAE